MTEIIIAILVTVAAVLYLFKWVKGMFNPDSGCGGCSGCQSSGKDFRNDIINTQPPKGIDHETP